MAFRILSGEQITDFSARYLKDELNQEDVQDLRRHLSSDGWMELRKQKSQADVAAAVTPISAGRTEEQIAKEMRDDLQSRLEAIGEIMTKAKREHGFTVSFGFSPLDSFGRVTLAVLEISKKLC